MIEPIVEVEHLSMKYQAPDGEIDAIEDVSFSVENGEFVSLIGPSGCGKSTILSIIAGLLEPSGGTIHFHGRTQHGVIGYMLQKDNLFSWRTILQNVTLGLEILNIKTKETVEYAIELLKNYGLYEFKDKYPSQLSGGMRQRCALIRTLAIQPDILLLDEAFSALDYQTRLAVADDIYAIIKKEKKTAIMVTHDISESISMSDRVIVLTKRPATVKAIHDIRFAAGRTSPFQCREQPEFRLYFNQIWRDVDVHI